MDLKVNVLITNGQTLDEIKCIILYFMHTYTLNSVYGKKYAQLGVQFYYPVACTLTKLEFKDYEVPQYFVHIVCRPYIVEVKVFDELFEKLEPGKNFS